MSIIERALGGAAHTKSAMLTRAKFETAALGEQITVQSLFTECATYLPVFADLEDNSNYKNDYLTLFEKVGKPYSTINFELLDEECNVIAALDDDTYGELVVGSNYTYFKLEWRDVLNLHGSGVYKIRTKFLSSLISIEPFEVCSCNFYLCPFDDESADNTVKMEYKQNSFYINSSEDFRGLDLKSMIRVKGFFGNPEPQIERSDYLNTSRFITDIQEKMYNEYTFETEFVPYCISKLLLPTQENKSLATIADEIFITDYNLSNHFCYRELPVFITKIKPIHNSSSKKIHYLLTAEDRNRTNVKRKVI